MMSIILSDISCSFDKWHEVWMMQKQDIVEMMNTVSTYKLKFELKMADLTNDTFDHFPGYAGQQKIS